MLAAIVLSQRRPAGLKAEEAGRPTGGVKLQVCRLAILRQVSSHNVRHRVPMPMGTAPMGTITRAHIPLIQAETAAG